MKYAFEKQYLAKVEESNDESNKRKLATEEEIEQLRTDFPNISEDYINYLLEIGSGSFRESQFAVKEFLFDFEDLGLEDVYEVPDGIYFFGDNFSGDFSGFDFSKNPEMVVEFWHDSEKVYETGQTFKAYIAAQMLIGENGEDERAG